MEWLTERFAPGPLFGWICLAALAMIPIVLIRARGLRSRRAVAFSSIAPFKVLKSTWIQRLGFVVPMLRLLAVLALIIALARPQSGGEYRDSKEGIAIQMVLDVSGSMAEQDFVMEGRSVRRLDAVKRVFEDFVLGQGSLSGRGNDLIGMTSFAMYADTLCPLTLDHGSLVDLLRETDIPGWLHGRQVREDAEAGFTSLGDAIVLATDDLRRAGEKAVAGVPGAEAAKSRVMILLTDGANNPPEEFKRAAPDPIEAAGLAAKLGIKIYTVGAVGSGQRQTGFRLFQPRRAQVDERSLKEIARITGGQYFRATDTNSLMTIYSQIDELERVETGERIVQDDTFVAKMSMLIALGLILAELLLVNTRYRRIP